MGRFRLDSSYGKGVLRLLLHGVFDGSSAWELRHALAGTDAASVIVDFSGVEESWEFGAVVLSAGMRGLDRSRISFVQVPDPIRRALAIFGTPIEEEAAGQPAWRWMPAAERV